MTEETIFPHFLKEDYDFPKLQKKGALEIAKGFADIVYETLKFKSSSAAIKRTNILKFVQIQVGTTSNHFTLDSDNYKVFLDVLNDGINKDAEFEDLDRFLHEIETENNENQHNLYEEICAYYKKREKSHRKHIIKYSDFLDKIQRGTCDQSVETPYSSIYNFLHVFQAQNGENSSTNNEITNQINTNSENYREKQIKYAYALVNLENYQHLKPILHQLSLYRNLTQLEQNFLHYLNENANSRDIFDYLVANFVFIYEKFIIKTCTDLIQLDNYDQASNYFKELETDRNYINLKELIKNHKYLYNIIQSIIFELYAYSYCNFNVMKLYRALYTQ